MSGNVDLPAREELHQIAATLASGVVSAFTLTAVDLDPTFKNANLANLVAVQWAAHKIYYAALLAALADPAWGSPQSAATITPAVTGLSDLVKAVAPTP